MNAIPENFLQQLRDAGLFVSKPYPAGHGWAHGVTVGKPKAVKGNSGLRINFSCRDIVMDAPTVVLYSAEEKWIVLMQRYTPVKGPGDFENLWESPQQAVDDILAFYFGDGERMRLAVQ